MDATARIADIKQELDGYRHTPSSWVTERIGALVDELLALEERIYGPAHQRIALKRSLRLAGIPFDPRATLADLQKLTDFIPKGDLPC